jgi:hypothetical protein
MSRVSASARAEPRTSDRERHSATLATTLNCDASIHLLQASGVVYPISNIEAIIESTNS